ncbi:hypothetical protein EDD92_6346 [Streptomyces sp. TLI_185]|nr:hypothetical protein EDD92_6346 [Streptomyces sp. TLI_185]
MCAAFARTFPWTALFAFLAAGIALLLPARRQETGPEPARVAAPERRS